MTTKMKIETNTEIVELLSTQKELRERHDKIVFIAQTLMTTDLIKKGRKPCLSFCSI
jgi:hypothetical protein